MEVADKELIFEKAFDIEGLSSFVCGIRELDLMIHKRSGGLLEFITCNACEFYIVYHDKNPVAIFVYSDTIFETVDGNLDATELDFMAVSSEYRNKGIGRIIINALSLHALQNGKDVLTVGAFINKKYSAVGFYQKCGFEQSDERQGNIVPMFKEL